jgi:predicted GNAT family N-acyltransferase
MINAIYINGDRDIKDAVLVRDKVFVNEQNIDYNSVFDGNDSQAIHVIVYEGKNPVGTGRMIEKDNVYIIGRIAVLKEKRGNYYGDLIVRMLITKAFDMGAIYIEVHSQLPVMDFHKKIGFQEYGEVYQQENIEHINMKLTKDKIKKRCKCN